jgi:hypothetical protein
MAKVNIVRVQGETREVLAEREFTHDIDALRYVDSYNRVGQSYPGSKLVAEVVECSKQAT